MKGVRSIGLKLEDVFKNEQAIFDELQRCRDELNISPFKVLFFHQQEDVTKIKNFLKRNSAILLEFNAQITKQYNLQTFFVIKQGVFKVENFRYCYNGDIIKGLKEYRRLIKHIQIRELDSGYKRLHFQPENQR